MKYRKLGKTGLMVSEICLGTMVFGNQVDKTEAINVIKSAIASGVNFFDTADLYAEGRSEEILGKALKEERHNVVLATKVAYRIGPGVNDVGLSRRHIIQGIEDSLRRLETDYIDLYYAHLPDDETPIEETLRAMDDLIHCGKVRYIACANFRVWQLCKALLASTLHNLARFDCIQPPYNLITRDIEDELLPLCASEGIGVCVYNPLAAGLLTGKYDRDKPPAEGTRFALEKLGPVYHGRYWSAINFDAVANLKQVAKEHGHNLNQFALAWILSNEIITSAICGATSVKQLEENLKATDLILSEAELAACDAVWQQIRPNRFSYGSLKLSR